MMNVPYFYKENLEVTNDLLLFDEETSRHIVQVLRMKPGECVQVTNGKGIFKTAEIVEGNKKTCKVKFKESHFKPGSLQKISIGISILKNANRFEWFLEKVTELGVSEIIPLICERTEKHHFRYDRMKNICISAMLQSQQVWLPDLHHPIPFMSLFNNLNHQQKFIAHCIEKEKRNLMELIHTDCQSQIILIGPEGDFTIEEVEFATRQHCMAVTLGETRLRTETAGVVAAALLSIR